MNVLPIERGIVPAVTEVEPVVSLTDRFAQAWAGAYVESGAQLAAIRAAANDPRTGSDPESLFALQVAQEEYGKRMTVTAGLVNHGVKGFETLWKS